MFELNNLASMKIGIASPEKILEWSYGEVTKSETINYRTHKPEMGGLLCERIFGPKKNWECHCGKYKRIRHKGVICDKCGVEVTKSSVRRERMGHIQLATPVAHIWYMRSIPSRIGILLNLNTKQLEKVIYYVSYVVIDPGKTNFTKFQIISDAEYREAQEHYGYDCCRVGMGGEAIRELLCEIDLEKEQKELQLELEKLNAQKEVYLASIDNERKLIAEGNKPTIVALNAFFDNLNTYDKQSQQILDKILESTGKIEPEFFDRLMTLYETIHNKREAICKNIQQTLEGNRQSLRDQLQAINAKVINQKALR